MKKIYKLIIIIIILKLDIVNAYSKAGYNDFYNHMSENNFTLYYQENGIYAYKNNDDGMVIEEYTYKKFKSADLANNYIENSYKETPNYYTVTIEEKYNIPSNKEEKYGFLSYELYNKDANKRYYDYYFKYDNIVIQGNGDYEYKDNIKNTINELFKDKEQGDEIEEYDEQNTDSEEKTTTIGQDKKTKTNNIDINKILLIGVLFISFLVLLTIYIIKRKSNKNTD